MKTKYCTWYMRYLDNISVEERSACLDDILYCSCDVCPFCRDSNKEEIS